MAPVPDSEPARIADCVAPIRRFIAERTDQYLPDGGESYYRGYLDALSWVEDLMAQVDEATAASGRNAG